MNRLSLLALPGLLLAAALPRAFAADEVRVLDPVIVSATRSEQPELRLPAALSVITREEIEASGAQHLADVLRASGIVQVSDFFGDGSRAQLDLRGFGEGAHGSTLVLVDGRRLNNPDLAPPDLNSIALRDIERIEIIAGSAGALYGDQAVGGVINIITRAPQGFEHSAELGAGSFNALQGRAAVAGKAGAWSFRISGEGRGSDNYRAHNRLEYKNALARAGFDWNAGEVFVEGAIVDEDLETPGALFAEDVAQDRRQSKPQFANDFSDSRTTTQRIVLRQRLAGRWTLLAEQTHRRFEGVFRLAFGATPAAQDSFQEREVNAFNPRVSGGFDTPWGDAIVTLGSDLQRADNALVSPFGPQTNRQTQVDAYGQLVLPLPLDLELALGARDGHVRNQVFDGFTFAQPTTLEDSQNALSLGLAWRFAGHGRLYARHDENYRFAKVEEFTNAGAAPASNQSPLRTQSGRSLEAGGEWKATRWSLRAGVYRIDIDDEIAFDPTSFVSVNLPATRRDGVMLDARWQPLAMLTLAAAGQYVDAGVTAGSFAGKAVPLVADRTARLGADLRLAQKLGVHAELIGVGRRAFVGDFDNSLGELPGHALLNTALHWALRDWRLGARVNNLLDREYSEYGASGFDATFSEQAAYYPSPERTFWLTVKFAR